MGHGPSSSHTMGPMRAAQMFLERNRGAVRFNVTLYGSLAATGKGHMTDAAILEVLQPVAKTNITWEPKTFLPFHPNGMLFESYNESGEELDTWTVYSIGGGTLANESFNELRTEQVYDMHTIKEIQAWCEKTGHSYWEYVEQHEGPSIWDYLAEVNACGGKIVTAPTCGSCGVMPAVLYHLKETREFRDSRILRALATAGLFGNVVRTNASVSGAEVGCQGEVGVACAMAAAAASQLFGGTPAQIEYAAEMGLEHHLGLTCDPVCGLVQIPCIERNAFAAARALDANTFSNFSDGKHRVSFDQVVEVMRQTGNDLPSLYKETSEGGLAKNMENSNN